MTPTMRAFALNKPAFLAELHIAAAARRMHDDRAGATEIDRTIMMLEAGQVVENDWSKLIANRLLAN